MATTTDKPVTASQIAAALMARWRQSFYLPNYTPLGWWECDVFELTKAGYFREYEIKVTRSDFFVDAKKERHTYGHPMPVKKHEQMGTHPNRPRQFWYVTPPGLLKLEEVPEWAGLLEVSPGNNPRHHVPLVEKREAPKLNDGKLATASVSHARGVCYYRFHELRMRKR